MNEAFTDVYVGWKPDTTKEPFLIGVISRIQQKTTFKYISEEVLNASRSGFRLYAEFQDIHKVYDEFVLNIFSQRLTPKSRYKTASVFKFWEISPDTLNDELATIAYTQALLPTDNFEFLADFLPKKGLSFITDLSASASYSLPGNLLEEHDFLTWHRIDEEDEKNSGILIRYENQTLGFVKKVHSNVFKKYSGSIRLRIYDIEKRETINKVFIKVELL